MKPIIVSRYQGLHIESDYDYSQGYENPQKTLCGIEDYPYSDNEWREPNSTDFGELMCVECHNLYYGKLDDGE